MPADFVSRSAAITVKPRSQCKSRAAPKAKQPRRRPRRARKPLAEHQRVLLADRIEAAIADGRLPADTMAPLLEPLFAALFPEDYRDPRRKAKASTKTAPGSPSRSAEYERRAGRGERLWHDDDADSAADDRMELFGRMLRNGHGRVEGWREQGQETEDEEDDRD